MYIPQAEASMSHMHTHTHTSTVNRATSLAVTQLLWGSYTGFTSIIIDKQTQYKNKYTFG